jgi:hypothetical protein
MSKTLTRRLFGAVSLAALVAPVLAPAAWAQAPVVKLTGSSSNFFKIRKQVAIPAYSLTFITQQQATAVAGFGARARLNAVLAGIDEATLKTLANEAYADLVAQLTAAGITPVPAEQARALAPDVPRLPGNREVKPVGAGITIDKSVRKGYATFGADAAPVISAFHNPNSPTGAAIGMGSIGPTNKLGAAAKAIDAVVVMPLLTFDFADMNASTGIGLTGGAKASVGGKTVFSLEGVSQVILIAQDKSGPGYAQGWRMTGDVTSRTPFATVEEGAAGVRALSFVDVNATGQSERGDAIVVDPAIWTELVRQHFRAFNAATVAMIVKARG